MIEIVILAAGQGSRMRSELPKVLHPLAQKPLLQHVLESAKEINPHKIHVIYGHGGEQVPQQIDDPSINWVRQEKQLGTGHAVEQAVPDINPESTVLILYGDVPLVDSVVLREILAATQEKNLTLLTVKLANPTGYGRIIRNRDFQVEAIVEEKDADSNQRRIDEVNSGIMAVPAMLLKEYIAKLDNSNAQGEFYLTDVIKMAVNDGIEVIGHITDDEAGVAGVNNRQQLAALERVFQRRLADQLMVSGATLMDPDRIDIRGHVEVGADVLIDVNVIFQGEVTLGDGVHVGANSILSNCSVAARTVIEPMSIIEDSIIGEECAIGPFARIRPGTKLMASAKIGNFVEVKKSLIGKGSKVNHLSYIGDTTMGEEVNIGAGTITCNYDGAHKHQTVIGDRVFVGSDSQLVAPVSIGDDCTIGAGSTVTKDTDSGELVISRAPQKSISGWQRPIKKK